MITKEQYKKIDLFFKTLNIYLSYFDLVAYVFLFDHSKKEDTNVYGTNIKVSLYYKLDLGTTKLFHITSDIEKILSFCGLNIKDYNDLKDLENKELFDILHKNKYFNSDILSKKEIREYSSTEFRMFLFRFLRYLNKNNLTNKYKNYIWTSYSSIKREAISNHFNINLDKDLNRYIRETFEEKFNYKNIKEILEEHLGVRLDKSKVLELMDEIKHMFETKSMLIEYITSSTEEEFKHDILFLYKQATKEKNEPPYNPLALYG